MTLSVVESLPIVIPGLHTEWLELGKSTYTLPSGRPFMHEPERRRGILATIETNRLATFESLVSQEGCSQSTIRKIAAEDGLQRHNATRASHYRLYTRQTAPVGRG